MAKARDVTSRARGVQHGPILRLISPDGLGEDLKPFIFLDFFNAEIEPGFGFGMHPHSGIATLTWQPGSDVRYRDTTGKNGVLKAGGLEWMQAGGGAWHQGSLLGEGRVTGFQLWTPLPPHLEGGPSFGQYVAPEEVPTVRLPGGVVRVLLGSFPCAGGVAASPIDAHQDMTYAVAELGPGARLRMSPPETHEVGFVFCFKGAGTVQGLSSTGDLMVLGSAGDIELGAPEGPAHFIFGTARRHRHPLVLGPSSVHTTPEALARGLARIEEIGLELKSGAANGASAGTSPELRPTASATM